MVAPVNASDLEVLFAPNRKPMFAGKPASWWHKNGKLMAQQSAFLADTDCRQLVGTVLELQRDDYWRRFSDDWGQFCQDTFGRPAEWVEQVVEGVRLLHLQKPSDLGRPIPATKAEATARAAFDMDGDFAETGRQVAESNKIRLSDLGQGTSAAYLAARLKKAGRDDLLEQIGPGKPYRSIRAAAIEAGIIRPVPVVRLVDDPAKVAASIRKHWSPERIAALLDALNDSPSQSPTTPPTHD